MKQIADGLDEAPESGERPSKTRLKHEAQALQDLGAALLDLPEDRLATLAMDDNLREALGEMRRMRGREAQRRQMQYIGKRLRQVDTEVLWRVVADDRVARQRAARAFQDLEHWRDRLLDDAAALTEWVDAHPQTPLQTLRSLIRNARRERAACVDPDGPRGGRHSRELFRLLREQSQAEADRLVIDAR
jgi:Uncharacterized protein conserved in bacteria